MLYTVLMLLALAVSRFVVVFLLPIIFSLLGRDFGMQVSQLKICWFSGLIRGAIAFGLSYKIQTKNADALKDVTFGAVIFTNVFLSALL